MVYGDGASPPTKRGGRVETLPLVKAEIILNPAHVVSGSSVVAVLHSNHEHGQDRGSETKAKRQHI